MALFTRATFLLRNWLLWIVPHALPKYVHSFRPQTAGCSGVCCQREYPLRRPRVARPDQPAWRRFTPPGVPWSAGPPARPGPRQAPPGEYTFEIVGRPGYCLLVPDSEVLIHARELTKRFGDFTAVDGIGFELHRGEAFGFLGPNGAG